MPWSLDLSDPVKDVGIVSTLLGGLSSLWGQDASDVSKQNASDTFYRNWLNNYVSRGGAYVSPLNGSSGVNFNFTEGSPVKLPYYTGTDELNSYKGAKGLFDTTLSTLPTTAQLSNIANAFKPSMNQGAGMVSDLFSGQRTQNRLNQFAPVAGARLETAAAQRQGILSNLQQRISELNAQQSNRGFQGGSTFDKNAVYRAALPDYQSAASVLAQAKLQNAIDTQGIRDQDWNMALQNINLPAQLAQQQMTFEAMPSLLPVSNYNQAYQVFNPFLLQQTQAATAPQATLAQPVNTWGNVFSTLSSVASDYTKNQAQQQAAQQYQDTMNEYLKAQLELAKERNSLFYNNPYSTMPSNTGDAGVYPGWQ